MHKWSAPRVNSAPWPSWLLSIFAMQRLCGANASALPHVVLHHSLALNRDMPGRQRSLAGDRCHRTQDLAAPHRAASLNWASPSITMNYSWNRLFSFRGFSCRPPELQQRLCPGTTLVPVVAKGGRDSVQTWSSIEIFSSLTGRAGHKCPKPQVGRQPGGATGECWPLRR